MIVDRPLNGPRIAPATAQSTARRAAPDSSRTVTALLHDTAGHAENVIRGEIRLALLRMHDTIDKSVARYGRQLAGYMLALVGMVMLVVAAVQWLSLRMPLWMATASVGVVVVIVGAFVTRAPNVRQANR